MNDIWIIKIDSLGGKEWDRQFGGNKGELLTCLQHTLDKGYILGGGTTSPFGGDITASNWDPTLQTVDYWIIKIDSLGNKEWDKRYGGTNNDLLKSIYQTADKGFILGGISTSGINGDKTQSNWSVWYDHWLVKIDSAGVKQWDKRLGTLEVDEFIKVIPTRDHGYILIANSSSGINGDKSEAGKGSDDYWVIKLDSLGNKQWDKTYGSSGKEEVFNIVQTSDGGYLVSGDSYSPSGGDKSENNLGYEQIWLVKIDPVGNIQWDKTVQTLGHDEVGYAIQANDGSIVMAECTNGGIGGEKTQTCWDSFAILDPTSDYWIIKYRDTTNYCYQSTITITTSSSEICPGDSVRICAPLGFTHYIWSEGETTRCFYANSAGNYSVTVTDDNSCTAESIPIAITFYPTQQVSVSQRGDTLIAYNAVSYQWYLNDSIVIGATNSFHVPVKGGSYTVLVTDSNGCTAASNQFIVTTIKEVGGKGVYIYPNAFTSDIIIAFTGEHVTSATFTITNLMGQTVYQQTETNLATGYTKMLDLSYLPNGVYFVAVSTGERTMVERVVKE